MTRLPRFLVLFALLLAGCETTSPLKAKKSEYRPMSTETKQSIADQSKDAEAAAKETEFGSKK